MWTIFMRLKAMVCIICESRKFRPASLLNMIGSDKSLNYRIWHVELLAYRAECEMLTCRGRARRKATTRISCGPASEIDSIGLATVSLRNECDHILQQEREGTGVLSERFRVGGVRLGWNSDDSDSN